MRVGAKRIDETVSLSTEIGSRFEISFEDEQESSSPNKILEGKVTDITIGPGNQDRELEESGLELQVVNARLEQRAKEEVVRRIYRPKNICHIGKNGING